MECNDKLKEIDIKICTCYHFHDIIKVKNFDFDILLDEKADANILVMTFFTKLWLMQKQCILGSIQIY